MSGGAGADSVRGADRDRLEPFVEGGATIDTLYGGTGADVLAGSPGIDNFFAGDGNDIVLARDRLRDFVDCGRGVDRAQADPRDIRERCERVALAPP